MEELERNGTEVELHGVGRKGIGFFRYVRRGLASARQDIGDRPRVEHADELLRPLMERYERGELDAVEAVFAKFNNPLSTPPTVLTILPIRPPEQEAQALAARARATAADVALFRLSAASYILRPSAEGIVRELLPLYLRNQMYRALVETAASEHGARRTAMKNATDSAGEMIDSLRRTYHRARQAQITQEIAEIVGGAEALRG
jgi:F-type H+-transporting ATPase subunit gamma